MTYPYPLAPGQVWPSPTCFFIIHTPAGNFPREITIGPSCGKGFKKDRNALTGCVPVDSPKSDCPIRPAPGDIVLYRNASGEYSHVAKIADDGIKDNGDGTFAITRVISKWGREGLYGHDPDDGYGHDWSVWHTNRGSNTLRQTNGRFFTDTGLEIMPGFAVAPWSIAESRAHIEDACPGLYALLDKLAPPSPLYDCYGYVFAESKMRIQQSYFLINQIERIRSDNGYNCQIPARHTGGHACGKK